MYCVAIGVFYHEPGIWSRKFLMHLHTVSNCGKQIMISGERNRLILALAADRLELD